MSTELTGRALDEAAARAMGWTQTDAWPDFLQDHCWMRPGAKIPCELPEFSTDPAHIPEMLAWLRGIGNLFVKQFECGDEWFIEADIWWRFAGSR